jgi:hypothetical protein
MHNDNHSEGETIEWHIACHSNLSNESRHGGAIRRRAAQFSAPSFELEQLPREVASGFHTVCRAAIGREWDRMSHLGAAALVASAEALR